MQQISTTWKNEQEKKLITAESFVEIDVNVGDPDAQGDAAASDNGHEDFSDIQKAVEGTAAPFKYASLERNLWVLDGNYTVNGSKTLNGYAGDLLSNEDCTFDVDNIPTIVITFSQVFDSLIPGINITWSTAFEEFATKIRLTVYSGTEQIYQNVYHNNSVKSSLYADISGYDKITIEVLEWCKPSRRARIERILIGIEKTYGKSDLIQYTHSMFVDPLSAELPKNQITFQVTNLDNEYNPDNPQGLTQYLMQRQSVTARYGYRFNNSIEWIPGGTFFMSEWDTPQNGITASFTARDAIEYMTDKYKGTGSGTLRAVATLAFVQAKLPKMPDGSNRFDVDISLNNITAPSDVDLSDYTIAEVLQLVANAACCVFYQDRTGKFHIEPLKAGVSDYKINRFNSYANSEMSLSKQLKAVDINDGDYIYTVGTVGETQTVNNPLISTERAPIVAKWIADYLVNRQTVSGEFRADPRLDALDRITNTNQFAERTVLVTEIEYSYNGAFRGSYEGRSGV